MSFPYPTAQLSGAGVGTAGHPMLRIQLMVDMLYPKCAYDMCDYDVIERYVQDGYSYFFSLQNLF